MQKINALNHFIQVDQKERADTEALPLRKILRSNSHSRRRERHKRRQIFQEHHTRLSIENARLRSQLGASKECNRRKKEKRYLICDELEHLIACGASAEQLEAKVEIFCNLFSEYGKHRCTILMDQLDGLELLLEAIQVTKMAIWALHPESNLTSILIKELALNCDQQKRFWDQRTSTSIMPVELKQTIDVLKTLKRQLAERNEILRYEKILLESFLSPLQRAKLVVWVMRNPACMHFIEKLWRAQLEADATILSEVLFILSNLYRNNDQLSN
uniref:Uncharacterized protein AlNc14C256G9727 n=1 Tax=Albugo laibachii Nc14 TaxID=890382 RepID=F0WTQ3_9STRA|nr:conserved hypothetical protein [Albugo laibachii Nc14]|eukprot:CCA24745.1 conserved hypothetical protein [Albugo laibachii Nc14]